MVEPLVEGRYLLSPHWDRDTSRSPPTVDHGRRQDSIPMFTGYCLFCDSVREVSVYLDKNRSSLIVLFRENMESCPIYWVDKAELGSATFLAESASLPIHSVGKGDGEPVNLACLPVLETSRSFGVAFSTIWYSRFQTSPDVNPSILSKVRLGEGEEYTVDLTYPDGRGVKYSFTNITFHMGSA